MLTDIYQQSIKRLAAEEVGHGSLVEVDARVTLDNPFCGDRVTMEIILNSCRISQVSHNVRGCLLCKAAASVIGSAAHGASLDDMERTSEQIKELLNSGVEADWDTKWRPLSCFHPVQFHKSRHGCVLLPFEALVQALKEVTTGDSSV